MTEKDHSDQAPNDKVSARLALVQSYDLDADVAMPDLEWAAAQWREGQRMMVGPTGPGVAAELEELAVYLESLSEEADRALCVGVTPEMPP